MGAKRYGLVASVAVLLASTSAFAEPVKKEAVIISMTDGNITARSKEGPLNVVVTPATKIREKSGIASSKTRDMKSLIPGLIFTAKGDLQGDTITAEEIDYKERDWRTAVSTKAGTMTELAGLNAGVAELRQAMIDGQEYVIQEEATVYFKTGSAAVAEDYKPALRALAQKAPSFGNYRISILGFADQRGNADANERLSLKRAGAVSNYLRQTGMIQPGRVLSPSAMGEGTAAPGEAAPTSDDEARRVVVRVITPKGQLTPQ